MRKRARLFPLIAPLLLVGGAGFLLGASSAHATTPIIDVVFNTGDGLTVTYNGAPLGASTAPGTVIPAGTYDVLVDNSVGDVGITFQLTGPGVSLDTDVDGGESATETWPETLQTNSTYTFQNASQPGSSEVFSTSSVSLGAPASATTPSQSSGGVQTNSASSSGVTPKTTTTTTSAPAAIPFRGTLAATVSAAGKLTLSLKGKGVSSLPSGRYTISVTDRSSKNGFTLQAIRRPAITVTSARFVGVRTMTITLSAGQWVFYPTFVGEKTYFIVVN
jgi:hypothetical protein